MQTGKRLLMAVAGTLAASVMALDIVSHGRSEFSIYCAKDCPASVRQGARDLQDYCEKVTGVKLPIVSEPTGRVISLGSNAFAEAAGVSSAKMALESYAVTVKGGHVYVIGPDTKDREKCFGGGTSAGTRNGVYALIEECLGVRWLMPGEKGDYYVHKDVFSVPDGGMASAPAFLNRRLPYIQPFDAKVPLWEARQKLGFSLYLNHSHNWTQTCPSSAFSEHPEWFAMQGGKRLIPSGAIYKLCATNPSTIRRFAEAAIDYFTRYPSMTCFSLSPSDGGGWCECETCMSMYETDPDGKRSVTPAILYFYNEVAKLVHPKFPDKFLAGYIYADYLYPPKKPVKLEDGLFLTLAPSFDYGYALYLPEWQKRVQDMMSEWPKSTTNISYYDLPVTWWRNDTGCINGPGLEILKFLYPKIKSAKMKGVYVYGQEAWGHSAATNYLLAKLSWDPMLDVDAVFDEFCDCAYMEGGRDMAALYRFVDAEIKNYYLTNAEHPMVPNLQCFKQVYARNIRTFETYVKSAESKIDGSTLNGQKALYRLGLFKNNVKFLESNCKTLGVLDKKFTSIFTASNDELDTYLDDGPDRFAYFNKPSSIPALSVKIRKAAPLKGVKASDAQEVVLRGKQSLVLRAKADGEIVVNVRHEHYYGSSNIALIYNAAGKQIGRRTIRKNGSVTIPGVTAGDIYRLQIITSQDFFKLSVENANWGLVCEATDEGVHLWGRSYRHERYAAYLHVPAGKAQFRFWLKGGDSVREVCEGELVTPKGRRIPFNCQDKNVDFQTVTVQDGEEGLWTIYIAEGNVVKNGPKYIDDYFIRVLDGIPPVVFADAENALQVQE